MNTIILIAFTQIEAKAVITRYIMRSETYKENLKRAALQAVEDGFVYGKEAGYIKLRFEKGLPRRECGKILRIPIEKIRSFENHVIAKIACRDYELY